MHHHQNSHEYKGRNGEDEEVDFDIIGQRDIVIDVSNPDSQENLLKREEGKHLSSEVEQFFVILLE